MIHQKVRQRRPPASGRAGMSLRLNGGQVGETISHYPPPADKILEKPLQKDGGQVGEGGPVPACASATAGRHRNFHSKMDE